MGLYTNGVKLMYYSNRLGVDSSNVEIIGRQELFLIPEQLKRYISQYGIELQPQFLYNDSNFIELFFKILGAKTTDSITILIHCCPKRFSSITNFIDFTGLKRYKSAFCDFDPSFI
jgi:hypothetical protein